MGTWHPLLLHMLNMGAGAGSAPAVDGPYICRYMRVTTGRAAAARVTQGKAAAGRIGGQS
jgi:hypothetical protein